MDNYAIRDLLLSEIVAQTPRSPMDGSLQQVSILASVSQKLPQALRSRSEIQEAILTQWGELFRTGLLAWGFDLSNPNPPFFHLTDRGRMALASVTRDPSNPAGYLKHLRESATLDPIAESYLVEALDCYVAGFSRASAVMLGAAAERILLELRDLIVANFDAQHKNAPAKLRDMRAKTVGDAIYGLIASKKSQLGNDLAESFEAGWMPLIVYYSPDSERCGPSNQT